MEKLKKYLNQALAAFSLLLLLTVSVSAQGFKENRRATRQAIKDYFGANVLPVLQEKRQALDKELSAEDKVLLESIRQEAKQKREAASVLKKEIGESLKNEVPLTDEQKIKFADMHFEKESIHKKVKPIAERNEEALRGILASLKSESEQWRKDIEEIESASGLDEKPGFERGKRNRPEGDKNREGGRKEARGPRGQKHRINQLKALTSPVGFLLWDGSLVEAEDIEKNEIAGVMAYPNPANSTSSNISFSIVKEGNVNVVIIDSNGEKVKTLINKTLQKGEHTIELPTADLEDGVYFYNITTEKGTVTKRFVVRK